MLSVAEAEAVLQSLVVPLATAEDTERVALLESVGRILAAPIASPLDFPHWDNSAMDGYAVRYVDVAQAGSEASADAACLLEVIEAIAAGQVPQRSIASHQAARIFTGAMLPEGADTIVMQENTRVRGDRQVEVLQAPPQAGHFVRRRGEFHRVGDRLLSPGICLGPADIAVLAAAQCATVPVFRRPQVGILSTGDELVELFGALGAGCEPEPCLQPGQIIDSNRYALAALVQHSGAQPHLLGRIGDQPGALRAAIAATLTGAIASVTATSSPAQPRPLDLVISSGGVSVGDHDHVDAVLEALGATLHIRAVAVKPGKPLTVATLPRPQGPDLLYVGLPGNPVSALVSFWRFVQPALRRLGGAADWQPQFVQGKTLQSLQAGGQRETYVWGRWRWGAEGGEFAIAPGSHSSGNLVNLAQTNALAKIPIGIQTLAPGDLVEVLLLG
ncbi:MAG: molybdopterin molybdotransferase MoeA [Synechococcales cyanobacterium CRU_2_2]|nr:molybdopterin molybdotransferase MoeA [Synechococcales cyanobacterium CRU_2_2]